MARTAASPARSMSPACPRSIAHDSAPSHTPYVERPPERPPTRRHGQMTRQLHASRYVPLIAHGERSLIARPTLSRRALLRWPGCGLDDALAPPDVRLDVDPRGARARRGPHGALAGVDRLDELRGAQPGGEVDLGGDQQLVRAEVLGEHVDHAAHARRAREGGLDLALELRRGRLAD